jgi:hypothetical protein
VSRSRADVPHLLEALDSSWSVPSVTWGPVQYATTFRAVWHDAGLIVRFDAVDPSPWHTMTARDDRLWEEEVVEIFLDPAGRGRRYAELEISPANVVCDVRMLAPWPDKVMDLAWNFGRLESRVCPLAGADRRPIGWVATALLPWADFESLPAGVALPPRRGDAWRFNLFRIKRPGGPARPEDGAVYAAWSPTGTPSFHVPAAFRPLVFAS